MDSQTKASDLKSIEDAIRHLSQKRHLITEQAAKAKAELGESKSSNRSAFATTSMQPIEEFNQSVALLLGFIQHTQLDQLAQIASSPVRVFCFNLLIGVIRGIGFAIGVVLIGGITVSMIVSRLPAGWLPKLTAML